MIYGYCRVSTTGQDLDKYISELKNAGVSEDKIFKDIITGTKRKRPGLDSLFKTVQKGDTIIIPDITRLGRSTKDLLSIVEDLKSKDIGIKSLKDKWLDTTSENPQQILMLTMFSALAQYERDLISQRTRETLTYKKIMNGGKSINGRPEISQSTKNMILKMYIQGTWKISEIQEATGCSRNTIYKYIRIAKEQNKL